MTEAFETGAANISLADVMVSTQKANVSFQAMLQVRNKLVEAYKDVMNMPNVVRVAEGLLSKHAVIRK